MHAQAALLAVQSLQRSAPRAHSVDLPDSQGTQPRPGCAYLLGGQSVHWRGVPAKEYFPPGHGLHRLDIVGTSSITFSGSE